MAENNVYLKVGDDLLVNWLANRNMKWNKNDIACRLIQFGQYLDAVNELKFPHQKAYNVSRYHHAATITEVKVDTYVVGQQLTSGYQFSEYPHSTVHTWLQDGTFFLKRPPIEETGVYAFCQALKDGPYGWINIVRITFNIIMRMFKLKYIFGRYIWIIPLFNTYIFPILSAKSEICSEAVAKKDKVCSNYKIDIAKEFNLPDEDVVMPMHIYLSTQLNNYQIPLIEAPGPILQPLNNGTQTSINNGTELSITTENGTQIITS